MKVDDRVELVERRRKEDTRLMTGIHIPLVSNAEIRLFSACDLVGLAINLNMRLSGTFSSNITDYQK